VVATDSEAAAPRELDEKPIWVRGVPPRCFFLSGFLSLFIPPPPKVNFLYRHQRLQPAHTMCCKCTTITLQTESGSGSGCARGREGRKLMRAQSFSFLLATEG
jgi:hypothetical protein